MEMLYHRILDGGLARTIVIPEAVDYRALVLAIGDAMFSDTMRKYPNPSDWPDDERRGRNSTGGRIHKHAANLQMKEPWHVYNNLEEWMHALFVYYAPIGQSPPPTGNDPIVLGNALMAILKPKDQINFRKQLHRWCKAAVPYYAHQKQCPSPHTSLAELIKHIQEALHRARLSIDEGPMAMDLSMDVPLRPNIDPDIVDHTKMKPYDDESPIPTASSDEESDHRVEPPKPQENRYPIRSRNKL